MKINVEVNEDDVRRLVLNHLNRALGDEAQLKMEDLKFQVKSKNNYRQQEWEDGRPRVTVLKDVKA